VLREEGEDLDNGDAGVALVKVRPLRIVDGDACQRLVEKVLILAVVNCGDGQRHPSLSSSTDQRHVQADALARLRGDEFVSDGCNRPLWVLRVFFYFDRLDRDARLPARKRLRDAVADEMARGHVVRLKEETPEASAKLRHHDSLVPLRQQDDLN